MKKLMLSAAIVCAAVMSQAAMCGWGTAPDTYMYKAGTNTKVSGMTAYLFDAATYDQTTLLADFNGDGINFTKKLDNVAASAGEIYNEITSLTPNQNYQLYMAVVNTTDNQVFLTSAKSVSGPEGTKEIYPDWNVATASKSAAFTDYTGFSSQGWYAAQAVPEPTSGLLLLLGVAGMALRRRRA